MIQLILADLQRVLKKVKLWILFLVMSLLCCFFVYKSISVEEVYTGFAALAQIKGVISFMTLIIGFLVFSAVYSDDFRSMSFITVIGRGMSRTKLVIGKMIVTFILTVLFFLIFSAIMCIEGRILCEPMDGEDTAMLVWTILDSIVSSTILIMLTSIFIYITEKIPVAIVLMLVLHYGGFLLSAINNSILQFILRNFYYTEVISNTFSDFTLGAGVKAACTLIACFAGYTAFTIIVLRLTFRKKELSF